MALIKCKECGKEFSDKASACIHCGCPIESDKKTTNNVNNNAQKENKIIDIIRYCIGVFCLLLTMSIKGIGIIFILLAVILILPITSKFIYEKINIPKALKIIIPIVLIIISMSMTPSFKKGFEEGRNKVNETNQNNTNKNNDSNTNEVIIGEWRLNNDDYFEFFDNGEFYYNGSTSNMVKVSSSCTIKGKYEQTSDTIIRLYDYELISDIDDLCEGLNKDYNEYYYSFPSDYSQMCGNTNGVCISGYKKINSTPSKLDKDGKKIS